ncbi:MAG TPA: DUF4358 domain-containing protein, partial [Candidatus Mediterraneibacter intestinigallinarum]|nr:DUF4358 domain-containing protein [Candidatus Mediterraneibacter intestinigallinarum]
MISKRPDVSGIMKYVVFLFIIVFVVVLMMYTSGSSKSFDEVRQSVEAALDTESLTEQEASVFKRNFGLNAADYTGVMYYSTGANISAEEILLIKVRSEDQIQEVTNAIDERVESRINDFEGYAPDEVKLLEDARQSVRGTYIFFAASEKADDYLSAFANS